MRKINEEELKTLINKNIIVNLLNGNELEGIVESFDKKGNLIIYLNEQEKRAFIRNDGIIKCSIKE